MTSEQQPHACGRPTPARGARVAHICAAFALAATAVLAPGCAKERFGLPRTLSSPYPGPRAEVVWAVAPLTNATGEPHADGVAIANAIAAQITQVRGMRALPVSRTAEAMRDFDLSHSPTPIEARRLATTLNADAIVTGEIMAYDPYSPPKLGMSLTVYSESDGLLKPFHVEPKEFNPVAIMGMRSDGAVDSLDAIDLIDVEAPISSAAEFVDGANHEVQMALRTYAEGRHDPKATSRGWRSHLASMTLFTEFASYRLLERLLDAERMRLARQAIVAEARRQSR